MSASRPVEKLSGESRTPCHPAAGFAYNELMEISFAPELEARLNQIASQSGKGPDEVVRELVANYLDHDQWFRQEVAKGVASLDQGKFVSHDEVRRRMERKLGLQ